MALIDDIKNKVELTIKIQGSFNPTIFQPFWFEKMGLLESNEMEISEPEVDIIHKEVALLSSNYFKLKVTKNEFLITTTPYEFGHLLIDVVIGIFTILNQTPIKEIDMMADGHFNLSSPNRFGEIISYNFGSDNSDGILRSPKLNSISIIEEVEKSEFPKYVRIDDCPNNKRHIQIYIGQKFDLSFEFGKSTFGEVIPDFFSEHGVEVFDSSINQIEKLLIPNE